MALIVGKMPADTENSGILVMFSVGNGAAETDRYVIFVGARPPDIKYPELRLELLGVGIL